MKSIALKSFLTSTFLIMAVAGTAVQAAEPDAAHDIYAAAGTTVYRIDALTGEFEEEGHGYDPVQDIMKTDNGLYCLVGDAESLDYDLITFSGGDNEYIGYDVSDMVGERDGKFYYVKNSIASGKGLYVYDPETGESEKAISPEVMCVETDGEMLYASMLITDEEYPDGICRIAYGPRKDTDSWTVLNPPEDGSEYLPELVKGKDGVYFLHRSSEIDREKGTVTVYLSRIEYTEPHNSGYVASFTIPTEGKIRLAGCTDAVMILEYQDEEKKEAFILRPEDAAVYQYGVLELDEEFPPVLSAGDDFYTIFGENDIYLVSKDADGEVVMVLPTDAKLWGIEGRKAVYSLNGSLFLTDADDVREEQEDSTADETESTSDAAREELSKALSDYWDEARTPSEFYSKLQGDPFVATLLKETEGNFNLDADLQPDPDEEEKIPVKAELRIEKEGENLRIGGPLSLIYDGDPESVELKVDTGAGTLEIQGYGHTMSRDISSLKAISEKLLSGMTEDKNAESSDTETSVKLPDIWKISSEEDTFSYTAYTADGLEDVSVPCTVYQVKIGWDEAFGYVLPFIDRLQELYTTFRSFQNDFSSDSSSFENDLNMRESVEPLLSELQKYAPDGIRLRFSVTEKGLVGVSLSAQLSEDVFTAHNEAGQPLGTVRIGETASAGFLVEADLTKNETVERDDYELLWSLPAKITMSAVNDSGDENRELMTIGFGEGKYTSDPESWVRGFSSFISSESYSLNQRYTPGTEDGVSASYMLAINPGSYSYDGEDTTFYISLREAPEQDAVEGASVAVDVKRGNNTIVTGTITVKGE